MSKQSFVFVLPDSSGNLSNSNNRDNLPKLRFLFSVFFYKCLVFGVFVIWEHSSQFTLRAPHVLQGNRIKYTAADTVLRPTRYKPRCSAEMALPIHKRWIVLKASLALVWHRLTVIGKLGVSDCILASWSYMAYMAWSNHAHIECKVDKTFIAVHGVVQGQNGVCIVVVAKLSSVDVGVAYGPRRRWGS